MTLVYTIELIPTDGFTSIWTFARLLVALAFFGAFLFVERRAAEPILPARLFRYPLHHVTGAMLVAWSGLSALAVPAAELQGITSAGTGLILWLSALATLGMALYLVRKPVRQLA